MDNKHIFDKQKSRSKKFTYIVVALLCIGAIGTLSYLSYRAVKPTNEPQPQIDNTDTVNNTKDDVVDSLPEVETNTQPETEVKEPEPEAEVGGKDYIMPVKSDEVSVKFSLETPVYSKTLGDWRVHDGVDFSAGTGAEVVAVNDGVVEDIIHHDLMGVTVIIKHGDGKKSTYSNLEDSVTLENGQIINQGDVVGRVGATAVYEIADGPHLHFEMSDNGKKIDPLSVIKK